MKHSTILCCACLLDIACQYNGRPAKQQLRPALIRAFGGRIVPICPEQLGGLATPRDPAEIIGGDGFAVLDRKAAVQTADGRDVTAAFVRGARIVLRIAGITGAGTLVTQLRSPSCSSSGIYDGTFSHRLVPGWGVCAALLKRNNITLIDIDRFTKEIALENRQTVSGGTGL